MDINDLPKLLERQNIFDAIDYCQNYCARRLDYLKSPFETERNSAKYLIPWILGVFMKYAIAYCYYKYPKTNCNKVFDAAIQIIGNQILEFQNDLEKHEFIYMPNYVRSIERGQIENHMIDIYRHHYYFKYDSKITKAFSDKFDNISYDRITEFILFYHYSIEFKWISELKKKIDKYEDVARKFSTEINEIRDLFLEYIQKNGFSKLIYARIKDDLISKPVIEINSNLYCPLYMSLYYAAGDILMYKLTDGDDDLHAHIGKFARENYLRKILSDIGIYENFFKEEEFENCKKNVGGPDVAVTLSNDILFLDSKSTSPNLGMFNLYGKAIEAYIDDISEYVVKLYNHMYKDCIVNDSYKPLLKKRYSKEEVYGIIVLREHSIIKLEKIFGKAIKELGIENNDPMKKWLIEHIAIVDINLIERITFRGLDLISFMKQSQKDVVSDFCKLNERGFPVLNEPVIYPDYLKFFKEQKLNIMKMMKII